MTFQDAINEAWDLLREDYNKNGQIDKYIVLLGEAHPIKRKSKWSLIDRVTNLNASTVLGPGQLHLARNWLDWGDPGKRKLRRAKNLLHEASHLEDATAYNKYVWRWKYVMDDKFAKWTEDKAEELVKEVFGITLI